MKIFFSLKKFILGIDATNLTGGSQVYLTAILESIKCAEMPFLKVIVWSNRHNLDEIPNRPWLEKIHHPLFERNYLIRGIWQIKSFSKEAELYGCDVLFAPGGAYMGVFKPVVCMFHNILPFESRVMLRYLRLPLRFFKYVLLRLVYGLAIKKSSGLIFLSHFVRNKILSDSSSYCGEILVSPHGLRSQFLVGARLIDSKPNIDCKQTIRIVYVSSIELYKNSWNVVEAVSILRKATGWRIDLIFAGRGEECALKKFNETIRCFDTKEEFCSYLGELTKEELISLYLTADIAVFASSCENYPMNLIEKMGMGLPIACSRYPAMTEILGEDAEYFDPTHTQSISDALRKIIENPCQNRERVYRNLEKVKKLHWEKISSETFAFLYRVALNA